MSQAGKDGKDSKTDRPTVKKEPTVKQEAKNHGHGAGMETEDFGAAAMGDADESFGDLFDMLASLPAMRLGGNDDSDGGRVLMKRQRLPANLPIAETQLDGKLNTSVAEKRLMDVQDAIDIQSLTAVNRACPDLLKGVQRFESTTPMAATTTTSSSSSATAKRGGGRKSALIAIDNKNSSMKEAADNALAEPLLMAKVEEYLKSIPCFVLEQWSDEKLSHEQLAEQINEEKRHVLPICNAFHDNELLVQAGRTKMSDGQVLELPKCCNGDKCEGRKGRIIGLPDRHPGFVLTRYMLPEEWKTFLSTGATPIKAAPCLLCYRNDVSGLLSELNNHPHSITVERPRMLQYCRNPVEGEGRYERSVMNRPSSREWQGTVDLIVRFQRPDYYWQQLDSGQWVMNQDNIIADPKARRCQSPPSSSSSSSSSPSAATFRSGATN